MMRPHSLTVRQMIPPHMADDFSLFMLRYGVRDVDIEFGQEIIKYIFNYSQGNGQ